jgi:excisionase family DNA binding protein
MYVDSRKMAAMLDVTDYTIRAWARRKVIPSITIGRIKRFDPQAVQKALERKK